MCLVCCHLSQLNRIHLVFNYKKSCEKNLRRNRYLYNTGFRDYYFSFFSRVVEFVCRSIAAYIFQMQKENKREHLIETACCRKTEYLFFF